MKNKIIEFLILFITLGSSVSYGFTSIPIWNNQETENVNAQPIENYLNLESESAILIELQTRKSFIRKRHS